MHSVLCLVAITLLQVAEPAKASGPQAEPQKRNSPNDWIAFHSRENRNDGPQLHVEFDDGSTQVISPQADATIIGYLANGMYGSMPRVTISLADTNRILFRFPAMQGRVRKAELSLKFLPIGSPGQSKSLPIEPFDVAIYELSAEWNESKVTWDNQPAMNTQVKVLGIVDPGNNTVKLDVTELARRLADPSLKNHGWILRVAKQLQPGALPPQSLPPGSGNKLEQEVLDLIPWATSVDEAFRKASDENKLVLAVVRADYGSNQVSNFNEQMLILSALSEPDVRRRILSRFIPVRVGYNPMSFLRGVAVEPRGEFAKLGIATRQVKAPAMVIFEANRNLVAVQQSIGTFDRDLTLRFLDQASAKAAKPDSLPRDPWKLLEAGYLVEAELAFGEMTTPTGKLGLAKVASLRGEHQAALDLARPLADSDGEHRYESSYVAGLSLTRLGKFAEAKPYLNVAFDSKAEIASDSAYLLGCLIARNSTEKADEFWESISGKYPRSVADTRAKARRAWPTAIDQCESLLSFKIPEQINSSEQDLRTETEQAVQRGVEFLLRSQQANGSWSTTTQAETYRVAITSLSARSLHKWAAHLEPPYAENARTASERATHWLNQEIGKVNPTRFNSFGAAYLLDYFIDLEESKSAVKGDVSGAVRLLLAGQLPNGSWSYDLNFGKNWRGGFGGWPETDRGRAHSVNTGQALLALARAQRNGFEVDKDLIKKGIEAMLAMREAPAVYTYTYPVPKSFHQKPEYSIGRAPLCELALRKLDANESPDLDLAISLFMKHRHELRAPVKLTESWSSKVGSSSYFYFYAYDNAARAIADSGMDRSRLTELSSDILQVVELDGSWVDFEAIGKNYGTAMALHVLYLAR